MNFYRIPLYKIEGSRQTVQPVIDWLNESAPCAKLVDMTTTSLTIRFDDPDEELLFKLRWSDERVPTSSVHIVANRFGPIPYLKGAE